MDNSLKDLASKMEIHLSPYQRDQFQQFATSLVQWNKKVNLTRITEDQDIIIKHFLDSLAPACVISEQAHETILDVGSGAGFPGVPLAIFFPENAITLMDASRKRVTFLKYIIHQLNLPNVQAVHARFENCYDRFDNGFDVIISRAFSEIRQFVMPSKPLLQPNGRIIAMKGQRAHEELSDAEFVDDFQVVIKEYMLPIIDQKRFLLIFKLIQEKSKNHI